MCLRGFDIVKAGAYVARLFLWNILNHVQPDLDSRQASPTPQLGQSPQ